MFFNSSSDIFSNSAPVIASLSSFKIPNSLAIAVAVILWSPVIITVLIPADIHFFTASFASSLGGSIIPTIPTKVSPDSRFLTSSSVNVWFITLYPTASTLKAFFAISVLDSWILVL